jgi:hypothetical protein
MNNVCTAKCTDGSDDKIYFPFTLLHPLAEDNRKILEPDMTVSRPRKGA